MLKFLRINDLDLKQTKKTKKLVFICNSSNKFLQYFCFLAIKKQLQGLYNKIDAQTYNSSNETSLNNILQTSIPLITKKCEAKFIGLFNLDDVKDEISQSIINSILVKLNSQEETVEIFYLDSLNPVRKSLSESTNSNQCFVIDFYNTSWGDLRKIIDYIFSYFNIVPTKTMIEKSYYTFLPAGFYELFTILNIIDLSGVDKNSNIMLEKTFVELIKTVIQKKSLKSVIRKDLKNFFYWKIKQSIDNKEEWKSFLKYKIMDVLEEDLSKDLKIEDKIDWWNDLINNIKEIDSKSVKENVTNSAYNLYLSNFIFQYYK